VEICVEREGRGAAALGKEGAGRMPSPQSDLLAKMDADHSGLVARVSEPPAAYKAGETLKATSSPFHV